MTRPVIGIDLGTTNSVVSFLENGTARVLQNRKKSGNSTPSVVALKTIPDKVSGKVTKQWIVGEDARNQSGKNPMGTLNGIKRMMGRKFDDAEVQEMIKRSPFKIVRAANGDAHVEVDGQVLSPVEVATMVLMEIKRIAEEYAGKDADANQIKIEDAVITVPAYFNEIQREATRQAGIAAGLKVLRIINEPTAAALAFGVDQKKEGRFAVYSWGGGTFDVSVLEISKDVDNGNKETLFEIKASQGDTFLGGENLDEAISEYLIEKFNEQNNNALDVSTPEKRKENARAIQEFRKAAEVAKIEFSNIDGTTGEPVTMVKADIPFVMIVDGAPVTFEHNMLRETFVKLIKPFIDKTRPLFMDALEQAFLKDQSDKVEYARLKASNLAESEKFLRQKASLTDVLLMGGTSRIPEVRAFIQEISGMPPNDKAHPKDSVAVGACVQGALLTGQHINGHEGNITLADVTPLSLGIRIINDGMEVMIPRNSTIPCDVDKKFFTAETGQETVGVRVYQGERPTASHNREVGLLAVELPPGTPAQTEINVIMSLNANGQLEVGAEVAGVKKKITLNPSSGLTEAEVRAILKRAEENKAADEAIRARQQAWTKIDSMLSNVAKDESKDWFTKADGSLKDQFTAAVADLTKARKEVQDPAVLNEKIATLENVRTQMGQAFMAAASAAAQPTEQAATPTPPPAAPAM